MPPSSATIVGSAGATSVMLREAISEPSIRPAKTAMTPRSSPPFTVVPAAWEATAVTRPRLPRSRQAQHPFGQDVAQNLRRSRLDRVRARAKELVFPTVAVADLRGRPRDIHRRLGHTLVELRPHQLEDRAFGAGDSASFYRGDRPVAVELERAGLDGVLGDLLADEGVRAQAQLARMLGQL